MSKKSRSILKGNFLYKIGQSFLDIQYDSTQLQRDCWNEKEGNKRMKDK